MATWLCKIGHRLTVLQYKYCMWIDKWFGLSLHFVSPIFSFLCYFSGWWYSILQNPIKWPYWVLFCFEFSFFAKTNIVILLHVSLYNTCTLSSFTLSILIAVAVIASGWRRERSWAADGAGCSYVCRSSRGGYSNKWNSTRTSAPPR